MATRHNLCLNPALGNDVTGWGGGSTPTRTAVSGFVRPWAARYTSGTFLSSAPTATGAVTVGLTYTVNVYLRPASFNGSGAIYIEWINSSGGGFGYPSTSYSLTAGTVGRVSLTAVAPANAVACRVVADGINMSVNSVDATAVLLEQAAAVDTYFDGDSSGASWDGAAGNSASTLTDSASVAASGVAGAVRIRAGSGRIQAVVAAPLRGAAGAVRARAGSGAVTAVRRATLTGATVAVRLRAGSGTATAAQAASLTGRSGALRIRAGAGTVTAAQAAPLTGTAGSIRARAGSGQLTTVQHAPLPGPPARVAIRAGSGTVSTIAGGVSVTLTGTAGSIRLHPSGGQAVAAQQTTLTAGPGTLRLRAAAGTITAVDLGDNILLPGRSGTIRLRASAGLVVTVRQPVLVGAAGAIRVLARAGSVTVGDAADLQPARLISASRAAATMSGSSGAVAVMFGSSGALATFHAGEA